MSAADLVIRGGVVIDGTGAPGRRADVAIGDGRIRAIGEGLSGRHVIDATGQVVAPGFIDIHTHYDAQVFWDPALTPSCFHGVTTVVAGNCGFSIAPTRPEHRMTIARTLENVEDMNLATLEAGIAWEFETFPEYLREVERRGTALNFTAYVGHTAVRLFAMGEAAFERAATKEELEAMCQCVRDAMRAGAAGFSTSFAGTHNGDGGRPVPSRLAEREEFEALCRAVADTGRGVIEVTPGENLPLEDIYELQRRIGRPFTYTALLTFPGQDYRMQAKLNDQQRSEGADVWPQVTPRRLTFQMTLDNPFMLHVAPAFSSLIGESDAKRKASYVDPAWRRKASEQLKSGPIAPRWETYEVSESERHTALLGRRITDIAKERGTGPLDVLLDLACDEDLKTRFRCTVANDDEDGVAFLLQQEGVALGLSDAGAHVGQLCDAPQATDLLGNWVRDRGVMPIERAIRKLTGEPADLFGFLDRGYLRPGAWADVAILDPATIAPGPVRRVRDFPGDADRLTADQPLGVSHVLVNGVPIRRDERSLLDQRPGRHAAIA